MIFTSHQIKYYFITYVYDKMVIDMNNYNNHNNYYDYVWVSFLENLINIFKKKQFIYMYKLYIKQKKTEQNVISQAINFLKISVNTESKSKYNSKEKKLIKIKLLEYIIDNLKNTSNEILEYIYTNTNLLESIVSKLEKLFDNNKFYSLYIECIKKHKYNCLEIYLCKKIKCIKKILKKIFCKFLPKTIGLLELTGTGLILNDIIMKKTFNYYWDNFSIEFKKFPIIDTQSDIDRTLALLEKYYNYGYRYFVGFSRSTIVNEVLNWFNLHQDAIGISATSTAPSLNIPKNIFRMTPTDNYIIEPALPYLYTSPVVYYIYDDGGFAALNLLAILESDPQIQELKLFAADLTNFTLDNITIFLQGSTSLDSVLIYSDRDTYIDFFSQGLNFDGQTFDILGIQLPNITGEAAIKLNNKYNVITYNGTCTSMLWRNGYFTLGSENFSVVSLNILNLLNEILLNKSVDNVNSHFGILQFNPITKDIIYPSFLTQIYSDNKFINKNLSVSDPYLGQFQAIFSSNQTIPNDNPKINKFFKNNGLAIALLELTNSPGNIDSIFNNSLYYYWYSNPKLPKFPIIDTKSSIINTIKLLDNYYNQGYRIFLGFSRSTIVNGVIPWFNSHPDVIGISITSSAELQIPKNFYRLESTDTLLIENFKSIFYSAPTLYYIYSANELVSILILQILKSDPNINLKSLGIQSDNSNLTVQVLSDFLNGSTSVDVIFLALFQNQEYVNLYNQGLFFSGNQYDGITSANVIIEGIAQEILDNKLYKIKSVFVNTSLLWRSNVEYLTTINKTTTTSFSLINALTMIGYILENKNFDLLGSHLGTLQFNDNNSLKYASTLTRVYKKNVNNFVNYQILFNDPLLGTFNANFI
jgi:hypothetical protein